ncbi:XRE family transcriptional regulator [Nocardioides eburneiflavus]|uniref:XRE family transcriptional regulator n=1 Tax=Nocardioides eburneiflavus TaxID=2518372 RepID=A0A4Z1CI72_9ACTN|nr:helix-turn-helix transcriptional regulator [Nocardioides eburneiflavus]TGN65577.1 XRE family transcriptional regulator [Nocardioides eburneiflavus]
MRETSGDEPAREPAGEPVHEPEAGPVLEPVLEPAWDAMVNWSEAEREWWFMGPFAGQVPGLVRRIRRILDVSQRGLAGLLGVSQSVVARWETGRTSPRVAVVQQMLQLAGLRVGFTDAETGQQVVPMRADGARTHAGSRFPAHVDLRARGWWLPRRLRAMTSIEAWQWLDRSRAARDPAVGFCLSPHDKRRERERWGVPDDHPAVHQFAAEVEWREEQLERRRQEIKRRRAG